MLFDNLPLPLPWYPQIQLQDRFRPNVSHDPNIAQLAPNDGVLPFQFFKNSTSEIPKKWYIRCMSNAKIQDYINGFEDEIAVDLTAFIPAVLQWDAFEAGDWFCFINDNNSFSLITPTLPDGLPPGLYYMEMLFVEGVPGHGGTAHFVSEIFKVPDMPFGWDNPQTCNYPCFKWSHNTDLKPMHYLGDGSFYNLLYLDTFITASEPEFEIEGETDGNNELIPTFQKAVIKYRISAIVPDFIKIALYMMQMHDNKYLITELGLRQGELKNPEVSATLTSDGAYSAVEVLFEQNTLITSTSCEAVLAEQEPFETASGQALTTGYCNGSGSVVATMTDFPGGVYGELWGRVGAGPFVFLSGPASRAAVLAGYSTIIAGSAGITRFKIRFRTFGFYTGESALSIPTPTC